jgi:hypothetical protein
MPFALPAIGKHQRNPDRYPCYRHPDDGHQTYHDS